MDGKRDGYMNEWRGNGGINKGRKGGMYRWTNGWMDGYMDGGRDGWKKKGGMYKWMDGGMDDGGMGHSACGIARLFNTYREHFLDPLPSWKLCDWEPSNTENPGSPKSSSGNWVFSNFLCNQNTSMWSKFLQSNRRTQDFNAKKQATQGNRPGIPIFAGDGLNTINFMASVEAAVISQEL